MQGGGGLMHWEGRDEWKWKQVAKGRVMGKMERVWLESVGMGKRVGIAVDVGELILMVLGLQSVKQIIAIKDFSNDINIYLFLLILLIMHSFSCLMWKETLLQFMKFAVLNIGGINYI